MEKWQILQTNQKPHMRASYLRSVSHSEGKRNRENQECRALANSLSYCVIQVRYKRQKRRALFG